MRFRSWIPAVASALLAAGCPEPADDDTVAVGDDDDTPCETDADGDGYLAPDCGGDDCDDQDPAVHPGAVEVEQWTAGLIDPATRYGCMVDLAQDSDGAVHALYLDSTLVGMDWIGGELRHATETSGSWVPTVLEEQPVRGYSPSLAVDSADVLHGSYLDWSDDSLRYLNNEGGSWEAITIDSWVQYFSSIALDADDAVHLAYFRGHPSTGTLQYATNAGGYWDLVTVDPDEGSGSFADLALDGNGAAHISYYYIAEHDLRHATNAGGEWVVATVDDAGESTGWYSDITVAPDGRVHITYQNGFEHHLMHAYDAGGTWVVQPVDEGCDGIASPSIATETSGALHIAYTCYYPAWPDSELRYAVFRGDTWRIERVQGVDSALDPALLIDAVDGSHIAYCDGSKDELWYLWRAAGDGIDNDCDGVVW